jgi:copper(I)-binding protein
MHASAHTSTPVRRTRLGRLGAAVLVATTLALAATTTGCSSDVVQVSTGPAAKDAAHLTVSDAWIKAAPSGMTGAFATLANDSGHVLRLESVTTDRAGMVELHETVSDGAGGMTMRPKEGGFTIAAGDEHELAPGGDHIMMMNLTGALTPGEEVPLVLHFSDGSTKTVTALVKDFTGADEKYAGSGASPSATPSGTGDMSGMESGSDGS